MKKSLIVCLIVLAVSILYLAIFAGIKTLQGEKVNPPFARFFENDTKRGNTFNWFALVLPVQMESQKVIHDTMSFTHRVVYPIAPQFQVVEPFDKKADTAIAGEIAKVISDSLHAIELKYWPLGNLDGQSKRVREYQHPRNLKTSDSNKVFLSLFGTASPEAEKYGFEQSIQPGNVENENLILAKNRLSRTKNILLRKLGEENITISGKLELSSKELQLTKEEQDSVLKGHREILDRMRYVEANVQIVTERLVVTTVTSPVFLPLWLLLISLLPLLFRRRERIEKVTATKAIDPLSPPPALEDPKKPFDWRKLFLVITIAAIAVIVYYFWKEIMSVLFWILLIAGAIATVIMIVLLRHSLWRALKGIILWIVGIFLAIYNLFLRLFRWVRRSTAGWPACRWIALVSIIINIVLAILLWLHWSSPC